MKLFLPILLLLAWFRVSAQSPFAETLLATDTNTLCPVLHGRICINDTFGVVFFEFGFDPHDTYDQTSGQHYAGYDTIFISIPITSVCDSTYYYYIAVLNQHASMIGTTLSFSAPSCGIGIEELSLENDLMISPDPVISVSEIKAPPGATYEVCDFLGRKKNIVTINGAVYLYRNNFTAGIYFCRVSRDGKIVTKKFLVQ